MPASFLQSLAEQTEALKSQGLYKTERLIAGPQQAAIDVRTNGDVQHVLNLCANNYLGLANHPEVLAAAHKALDEYGYGMASVRFICGTQTLHKELEQRISDFLGTEDTILYPSCFDANGGLFETILSNEDAVISDALNHASIIDGIRLSKAQRFRYQHNDMQDLQAQLEAAAGANAKLVVSDGVFSMDGTIANLEVICDLAEQHDALTMIDDCHATGFLGDNGRGTHEFRGTMGRIDIITGTLGKALGGASGGFTSGRKEIVGWQFDTNHIAVASDLDTLDINQRELVVETVVGGDGRAGSGTTIADEPIEFVATILDAWPAKSFAPIPSTPSASKGTPTTSRCRPVGSPTRINFRLPNRSRSITTLSHRPSCAAANCLSPATPATTRSSPTPPTPAAPATVASNS